MNRLLFVVIIWIVSSFSAAGAGEGTRKLPPFENLTVDEGLSSNEVLHILPLTDGRMVVTTDSCIHIYDGERFEQYPCTAYEVTKISDYHGAYHVYADKDNRLWVKEWGNVWCMNLNTGTFVDLQVMQPMTDVFVDSQRQVWLVADTTLRTLEGECYHTRVEWENLQDVDADDERLYLFYSTGTVACYDRQAKVLLYTSQSPELTPYVKQSESVEMCPHEAYEVTSLVVRGQDGCFYQLRGGERYIFLCFDPDSRQWRTVFETSKGPFHSLCIPTDELALIGCPTGVWSIGLLTGEMVLHSVLKTADGQALNTKVNSVVCDSNGGLWLGSSWKGVLRADTLFARPSYTLYYIVAFLVLVFLVTIGIFHRYAARQRNKEHLLMQRIQELIESTPWVEPIDEESCESREKERGEDCLANGEQIILATNDVDQEFLAKAIALVEQNLHTSGYTVERLATDLCMERTGLYRKLSTMVNQSPTLFMRSIRMKRAAQLLLEGGLTVAEIAERTGFSSASYFSRLFQETYGCKPSEYKGGGTLDEWQVASYKSNDG